MGSWFKAHRKKVITHTSIIVGFVLLTIFVAEPLFDRLESIEGEARLHRISLPNATSDIRCHLYTFMAHPELILADGWAFIYGQDANNSRVYLVLKSSTTTYVFDTATTTRLEVTQYYKTTLNLDLDNSGFISNIPLRKIKDDYYSVGIYISKGDIEAFSYTEYIMIKSKNSVSCLGAPLFISEPQILTLPAETSNMRLHIDSISEPEYVETKYVQIDGWAFIEGHSPKDSKTYVVLKSDINTYVLDTMPRYLSWLPAYLRILMDLDWAGFKARIPKEQLENGTYEVGIYIKKGDIEALQYTDDAGNRHSLTIASP